MKEKCVACGYEFKHPSEYHNDSAGILLCQKCSFKVAKHYINGWQANFEIEARIAQQANEFIKILEKIDGERGELK